MEGAKAVLAQGGAVAEAELEALGAAVEKAEQMVALEAVAVAVALEAVADWEAETEREETLTARELGGGSGGGHRDAGRLSRRRTDQDLRPM